MQKKQYKVSTFHKNNISVSNGRNSQLISIIFAFIFLLIGFNLFLIPVNATFKDVSDISKLDTSYYQGAIFLRNDSKIIIEDDCDKNVKIINTNEKLIKFISQGDYQSVFKITNCAIDADGDLCDVQIWTSDYNSLKDDVFATWDGVENCKYRIEVVGGNFNTTSKIQNVYFHLETAATQLRLNFQYYKSGTNVPANITKQFGKVMDIDVYCNAPSMTTTMYNGCEGFKIEKTSDTVIYTNSNSLYQYDKNGYLGVYNKGNTNRLDYSNNNPNGIAYYSTSFQNGKTYLAYEGRICGIYFTYTTPNIEMTYKVKYDANGGISNTESKIYKYDIEYNAPNATKIGYKLKYWNSPRENGYNSVRLIKDGIYYLNLMDNYKLSVNNNEIVINNQIQNTDGQWEILYKGNGFYKIKDTKTKKDLSVKNNQTTPKTELLLSSESSEDGHLWKIIKNDWLGNDSYAIISKVDGIIGELMLGTTSGSIKNNETISTQFLNRGIKSRTWYPSLVNGQDFVFTNTSTPTQIKSGGKIYNLAEKNSTITLTAEWEPNIYNISYDGNGATSGSMNQSIHTYDKLQKLEKNQYKKNGYIFAGWSTEKDGELTYIDQEEIKNLTTIDNKTLTLYAVWIDIHDAAIGNNTIILKQKGLDLIKNNKLETYLKNEINLKVEDNDRNITINSYNISNISEIEKAINNTTNIDTIEIKFNIKFSDGKISTKTLYPCILTIVDQSYSGNGLNYIRYIMDSETLNSKSEWLKDNKNKLLNEILNKKPENISKKHTISK